MKALQIDPKYHVEIGSDIERVEQNGLVSYLPRLAVAIVKSSNGEPIPPDEPVVLFRARDHNALPMLQAYRQICVDDGCNDYHLAGVDALIEGFQRFWAEHPERMKQPGVTRGL